MPETPPTIEEIWAEMQISFESLKHAMTNQDPQRTFWAKVLFADLVVLIGRFDPRWKVWGK